MSGDRKQRAFPVNELDRDWTFFSDFGGKGGGLPCPEPLGTDRNVLSFENDPFMVYNRLLILTVDFGFDTLVWTDGGADANCSNTKDTRVPVYVAVSSSSNLTEAEIKEQDRIVPASFSSSDDPLFFTYRDRTEDGAIGFIPQPTDPAFDGNTYVTLYWGDPSYVTNSGTLPGTGSFDEIGAIKEDYEERV